MTPSKCICGFICTFGKLVSEVEELTISQSSNEGSTQHYLLSSTHTNTDKVQNMHRHCIQESWYIAVEIAQSLVPGSSFGVISDEICNVSKTDISSHVKLARNCYGTGLAML